MGKRLTLGELEKIASRKSVSFDSSLSASERYEHLRQELDIERCRQCDKEFVDGWTERFCSDSCEVEYLHENDLVD